MRNTSLLMFGAGGTLGGVKKLSSSQTVPYSNWLLAEGSRALVSSIHHPLVAEYFLRLHEVHTKLQKLRDSSDSDFSPSKLDKTHFNHVMWNVQYSDEFDISEKLSHYLLKINDNVILKDQLRSQKCLSEEDRDILRMVEEDIEELLCNVRNMDSEVNAAMIRRVESGDALGSCSSTWELEVTGKAGGEEASLFASELADMYRAYAFEIRCWSTDIVHNEGDGGAISSAPPTTGSCTVKVRVKGDGVYRNLRHEIGVHKVQRVPITDQSGKMQTSTAVVTLMPVLDPVSVDIHEEDCNIEFVRGSGPGGQGMQSSSNAVCLTHRPSGISVKCHQSRSALGNKELALQTVAQQILMRRIKEQNSSLHEAWCNQWSSGERSDKMRTYNYPQNRVTDHRLGKDYSLGSFMDGGAGLRGLHDDLNAIDERQQLVKVLLQHLENGFNIPA
uniref:Putative peptide chain release factor 1 n=1 Tax=Trypanosoma congolense (strain IL3000) TaxID=1068625 RepID=G0UJR2_TRYCI|nr:putative peptide chain release factor 1 [Trypanosoma congolense IL3000]